MVILIDRKISKYNHICFLSAHCFPTNDNYLKTLFLNFNNDTIALFSRPLIFGLTL